jgi:hypothetical protein
MFLAFLGCFHAACFENTAIEGLLKAEVYLHILCNAELMDQQVCFLHKR